ncbi:MAG: hypothetical protein JXA09_14915 [Anaerolineae bacterium]|nr:hypothetical protein [Anaerolineae bacterium]
MKRRTAHVVLIALLAVLAAALLAACGADEAATEPAGGESEVTLDGKALAEERCSTCHPYSRVEEATKSAADWKANVERMVAHGAQLNAAEQAAVIEYLSEAFPE